MIIEFNTNIKLNNRNSHRNIIKKTMGIKSCSEICFKSKTPIVLDTFESQSKLVRKAINKEIELYKIKRKQGKYFAIFSSELLKKQEALINKIQKSLSSSIKKEEGFRQIDMMDKYIIGYKSEKDEIMASLIEPLLSKKGLIQEEVPSAVLIAGDNRITTGLVDTAISKLNKDLKVLYLGDNIQNNNLERVLLNILEDSRKEFLRTGKRTLLVCKDVERFLNFKTTEAKLIGRKLNEEDEQKLQNLNNERSLVSFFKALLDVVAKEPSKNNSLLMNSATTFLMTSENPHFIHPDLAERNGKINLIRTEFPKDKNLKDIILSCVRRQDGNFEDFLSEEDWELVLKELNPKISKGAFSPQYLNNMISRFYLLNKTKNLKGFQKEVLLIRFLLEQPRDVSNKDLKKQARISKVFDGVQKKKSVGIIEIEDLILKQQMGLSTKEEDSILEEKIIEARKLLDFLDKKSVSDKLSKREIKLKRDLEKVIELLEVNN